MAVKGWIHDGQSWPEEDDHDRCYNQSCGCDTPVRRPRSPHDSCWAYFGWMGGRFTVNVRSYLPVRVCASKNERFVLFTYPTFRYPQY
jgi:hypothetical protein